MTTMRSRKKELNLRPRRRKCHPHLQAMTQMRSLLLKPVVSLKQSRSSLLESLLKQMRLKKTAPRLLSNTRVAVQMRSGNSRMTMLKVKLRRQTRMPLLLKVNIQRLRASKMIKQHQLLLKATTPRRKSRPHPRL